MPSKVILEQKQKAVAELAEQIKNSVSGVLVNYQGITVEDDTAMRKALREAGVRYTVVKNTLTGRACEMVGYGDMKQYLTGMTAIAIGSNDPIAPAKVLKEYADKVESFSILAGYLDGKVSTLRQLKLLLTFLQRKFLSQSSSEVSNPLFTDLLMLSRQLSTRIRQTLLQKPNLHGTRSRLIRITSRESSLFTA